MKDYKLVAYTMLGNVSIAFLAIYAFALTILHDQHLLTLVILIATWFIMDYIKLLERSLGLEKRVIRIGRSSYFITCVIGLVLLYTEIF